MFFLIFLLKVKNDTPSHTRSRGFRRLALVRAGKARLL